MSSVRVGRYEAIRPIASGGMATVYLGRLQGAGGFQRLVAIKLMHPHIAADPDFVEMFLDEARLAAGIRHPNVVATLDIESGPVGLVLVMEFVDGASVNMLSRALRKRGVRLPIQIVLRLTIDMLEGLHAAHELKGANGEPLGLVHRDVSPQNVLVGRDGIAKITDFGVARAGARLSTTRASEVKGKMPYMSPEQMRGLSIDRRSDVFAAGAVLWEWLVGRRLFKAENEAALVSMVLAGPSQSPRQIHPDVPAPVDAVCMRALSSLEHRFATAAAFAEALETAAQRANLPIASHRQLGKFVTEVLDAAGMPSLEAQLSGAGAPTPLAEPVSSPFSTGSPPMSSAPVSPAPRSSSKSAVLNSTVPIEDRNRNFPRKSAQLNSTVRMADSIPLPRPQTPQAAAPAAGPQRSYTPPPHSAVPAQAVAHPGAQPPGPQRSYTPPPHSAVSPQSAVAQQPAAQPHYAPQPHSPESAVGPESVGPQNALGPGNTAPLQPEGPSAANRAPAPSPYGAPPSSFDFGAPRSSVRRAERGTGSGPAAGPTPAAAAMGSAVHSAVLPAAPMDGQPATSPSQVASLTTSLPPEQKSSFGVWAALAGGLLIVALGGLLAFAYVRRQRMAAESADSSAPAALSIAPSASQPTAGTNPEAPASAEAPHDAGPDAPR